jgi:LPS sulfotransferase NodH
MAGMASGARTMEAAQFHVRRLARQLGLWGGHDDYRRFIILGRGRTGSNFLRGLLNSHPQVITFGELFRFPHEIGWEFPDYDRFLHSPSMVALLQNDPIRFLQKQVFGKVPRRIAAVGFKIFYYHAQEDSRRSIWPYLEEQKDLKVIHIKRKNTLRMILSEKKAFKTNRWTNTTGVEEAKFSVAIDYEECVRRFAEEQAAAEEYDHRFAEHPMLQVLYEDLVSDCQNQIRFIQAFLGLDYQALKPSTYRQSNQRLSEAITNYAELRNRFIGTRWEVFFDEPPELPDTVFAPETANTVARPASEVRYGS